MAPLRLPDAQRADAAERLLMRPHALTRYLLRRSVLLAALIACTAILTSLTRP